MLVGWKVPVGVCAVTGYLTRTERIARSTKDDLKCGFATRVLVYDKVLNYYSGGESAERSGSPRNRIDGVLGLAWLRLCNCCWCMP